MFKDQLDTLHGRFSFFFSSSVGGFVQWKNFVSDCSVFVQMPHKACIGFGTFSIIISHGAYTF